MGLLLPFCELPHNDDYVVKKIRLSVLLHINLTRRDKNYNILIPFIFVKA